MTTGFYDDMAEFVSDDGYRRAPGGGGVPPPTSVRDAVLLARTGRNNGRWRGILVFQVASPRAGMALCTAYSALRPCYRQNEQQIVA